eukprot:365445-Chlamydomonas_euryale.AAC.12
MIKKDVEYERRSKVKHRLIDGEKPWSKPQSGPTLHAAASEWIPKGSSVKYPNTCTPLPPSFPAYNHTHLRLLTTVTMTTAWLRLEWALRCVNAHVRLRSPRASCCRQS